MQPVSGGWESHTIRGDGDYEAKKRAAIAQASQNQYIQGIQEVFREGAGDAIAGSRTRYGNVNVMPQEIIQGDSSIFQQGSEPGNTPMSDPLNQTGNLATEASATSTPQADPQDFETAALDERLKRMAKGGMQNLNSIPNLYPRG